MSLTIKLDKQGPLWPLGFIKVASPGTPVNIMSLVDPSVLNDPGASNVAVAGADEYAWRCTQVVILAVKPGALPPGVAVNTGNVYVLKRGANNGGAGTRNDAGMILAAIPTGTATVFPPLVLLPPIPLDRTWINPYDILIDADTANDGVFVYLVI